MDDRLSSSAPPNLEKDISEFESVTPEVTAQARKQTSQASSTSQSYKGSVQTPGLLQSGDGAVYRNGQSTLPAEKAFSIQIGWRQFKLSGASIMSDGESAFLAISATPLTSLERLHTSPHILKSRCDKRKAGTEGRRLCISIEIRIPLQIYADIYRVSGIRVPSPITAKCALRLLSTPA